MTKEIREMGDAIIRNNNGKMMFNLTETRRIIGRGENHIAATLHEAGIKVKKMGKEKKVDAYQIAEFICTDRIAPIDNTSRGCVIRTIESEGKHVS